MTCFSLPVGKELEILKNLPTGVRPVFKPGPKYRGVNKSLSGEFITLVKKDSGNGSWLVSLDSSPNTIISVQLQQIKVDVVKELGDYL